MPQGMGAPIFLLYAISHDFSFQHPQAQASEISCLTPPDTPPRS
jgi:hypothetical protein